MREAGCTAAQEVGFTLANAIEYVDAAVAAGHGVDDFAGQISFFFACHGNFLEEVSKFRAARRLWARVMKERFGAKNPRSMMLRFHTQTGGATLTAQQPENNVVRTTVQALAAVLGGTQSLHTNSMDESLGLPSQKAVQTALRTQQVLAFECGVGDVVDPLGGSYCIEALTDQIEADAVEHMKAIEELGGALVALESGHQQRLIQEAAYRFQREIEVGHRKVVGLNAFVEDEVPVEVFEVDPSVEERQVERVRALRRSRNNGRVDSLTGELSREAQGTANLLPLIRECVANRVTIGEISHALRRVWGEYDAPVVI
jgi:methylmalonyl-CoA mutase N-terminal domain/subunit